MHHTREEELARFEIFRFEMAFRNSIGSSVARFVGTVYVAAISRDFCTAIIGPGNRSLNSGISGTEPARGQQRRIFGPALSHQSEWLVAKSFELPTALMDGAADIEFGAAASANVTFDAGATETPKLVDSFDCSGIVSGFGWPPGSCRCGVWGRHQASTTPRAKTGLAEP